MYWEEGYVSVLHTLLDELLDTRAFALRPTLHVKQEGDVRVQIVLAVDVVCPDNVLDVEARLADATNEALAAHFTFEFICLRSLIRKRVNDNSEEDVHQDNVDEDEEGEIKYGPTVVSRLRDKGLPHCFADAASSPHTNSDRRNHAVH